MDELKLNYAESTLTTKRKRIMIYFIEAAQKLIQSEGVDGLSIRKIANEAGYNSATLYNYFRDLEHLTLFGSVPYLQDYVVALSQAITPDMPSIDQYRTIYKHFNDIAFRHPDIFHNMFFGRHSDSLGEVLQIYFYELFPNQLDDLSEPVRRMMVYGSMKERDSITMQAMVEEGFIAPEKADMTLELIIAVHQTFIYEAAAKGEHLDLDEHKRNFDQIFEYILAMGR